MRVLKSVGRLSVLTSLVMGLSAYAEEGAIEEVVVTGSYIKGTPEDAELPVDVIRREDLEDIGNPTVIEMVRNLSITSGNLGETNSSRPMAVRPTKVWPRSTCAVWAPPARWCC